MARKIATATTAQSDPTLESFAVSQGIANNGRRAGQTYAVVTMWANGRPTLSKIYADNKEHLLSVLDRMIESVNDWKEPTATAAPVPVVQTAQAPDIAALQAQLAAAQAENARLIGKSAPAAAVPANQPAANSAQSRLSRISRRK